MKNKLKSKNIQIAIFLDTALEIAEELLEENFDDVIISIASPTISGAIGSHIPQNFDDTSSNKKYSHIVLHPALFLHEHKAMLFATIIHELVHAALKHEYLNINEPYIEHGKSFKERFIRLGVDVDENGNVENIDKNGTYFSIYETKFKNLHIPVLYNHEHFKVEEKVSIQGRAKCPSCELEVITFNSKPLICKDCHIELDNNYMKLLMKELKARKASFKSLLQDFEYLCLWYPLKSAKNIAYVQEALMLADTDRLEALAYSGTIDKDGKEKLYKAAYNLIISHKNIAILKGLTNV